MATFILDEVILTVPGIPSLLEMCIGGCPVVNDVEEKDEDNRLEDGRGARCREDGKAVRRFLERISSSRIFAARITRIAVSARAT